MRLLLKRPVNGYRQSPVIFGIVMGLFAVGYQIFFHFEPPPAYAICTTCHSHDMIAWLVNNLTTIQWDVAPVGASAPLLTPVGLLVGAFLAARLHREVHLVCLGRRWHGLIWGLVVMNVGLALLGCPTRLVLLSAYGDKLAFLAVIGLIMGVGIGTFLMKKGMIG
jgi:hypothetical protein